MGYITTVMLYNDAMGDFEKDPKALGEAILKAARKTEISRQPETHGVGYYANPILVHPARHADNHALYLHYGNTLIELSKVRGEEHRKEVLKVASEILKQEKKRFV